MADLSIRDQAEIEKLYAEINKLRAETQQAQALTRKLQREIALYPVVVGSGVILAFTAIGRLLI